MRGFHGVRLDQPVAILAVCRLAILTEGYARYSSDSVGGTSAAGTNESATPEKWKDKDVR